MTRFHKVCRLPAGLSLLRFESLGAVLAIGTGLLIKFAPSWADPANITLATAALFAVLIALLQRRR
ncbi:hypothetical protein LG634_36130 [Streptomyces bambusae]|uniref:hypothetical protein n=1 Tax=Streptomyces bambusae TaxID=1550616 RepID=UPI001CFF951C|nr:hypothetical protein [Streptomyces bambusae]MCB5170214.1 hypothetical protein [Streptomyces bambusae]